MDKTFYIFRHGLATHSKYGYGKKIVTAPILPEGIAAIEKMAKFFKTVQRSVNYSSEFLRCRQTVKIISLDSQKKFIFDNRLNEQHHETFSETRVRVAEFLTSIPPSASHILICSHGGIVAALKHLITDKKHLWKYRHDYPHTGELLIINKNRVKIISFNEIVATF